MADNVDTQAITPSTIPTGTKIATRGVAYSDDANAMIAPVGLVTFDGANDAKTATDVTSANPLPVSVTGSVALPTGASTLAEQQSQTMQQIAAAASLAILDNIVAGSEAQVDVVTLPSIPAGSNNIGDVDVLTLPAIPAGTNNIGDVDVLTVPADPFGTNADAGSSPGGAGSMQAKLRTMTTQLDAISTSVDTLENLVLTEDASHSSGHNGLMPFAVRRDADTSLVDADNDYAPLQVNAAGSLKVAITAGAGSGGTSIADGASFTPNSTSLTAIGGYRDDAAPATVTEGAAAAVRLTENRAIHVNLRDAAGAELAVGGGTQYTEDAAAAANPVGTALNLVRDDARTGSLTTTDGDNISARGTNAGELYVKHVDAIPITDNAGSLTIDGTVAVSALPALVAGTANIGDVDVLSVPAPLNVVGGGTEAAALRVTIANDSTGVVSVDDNGGSLTVDGSVSIAAAIPAGTNNIGDVDILSLVPGTGATALGKAEDAVHTSGDVGVMALAVRQDTLATLSSATGDYEPLHLDASGRVYVNAQGPVAHDAAVSGNPLLAGFEARTTDITPVASADAARAIADTLGKQVVLIGAVPELQLRGAATYTTTTAADVIAAQGAGIRVVVMSVLVTNAHATVGTKVEIRDGTTVRILGFAAANGGGYSHNGGGVPLFISTANTAVTGRCATTGADVDITVSGYRIAN